MTHTYQISGMTCGGCIAKVKNELFKLGDVTSAEIQLANPQATITMLKHVSTAKLQEALNKAGNFTIEETATSHHAVETVEEENASWLTTYKPILLIAGYILLTTIVVEFTRNEFNLHNWMSNFMAGFFLVFSFFKFLDLQGFADSYSTYDIVARKWRTWGLIYPFVEFGLGIAFLLQLNPLVTNGVTFVVMAVSAVGVLQSLLNKRKIRCACLGAVFNLPMSTVTLVEDGLMIAMSLFMIISIM